VDDLDEDPDDDDPIRIAHHHPGCLRIRAAAFERPDGPGRTLRDALGTTPGVYGVDHCALTGSVRVLYDTATLDAADVLARACAVSSRRVAGRLLANAGSADARIIGTVKAANLLASALTNRRTDLRLLVPVALAAGSAASWLWGGRPRTPAWESLLYWAYTFFRDLHERELCASAGGDGSP
jgi:hypothetical protein